MATSTSTEKAKLQALLSLINSATQQAIEAYERDGGEVPSLNSLEPHPYGPSCRFELQKSLRILEGACEQLCSTLAPPGHTVMNRLLTGWEVACLRLALRARIADVLANHPNGLHVNGISQRSGVESKKLGRILRVLATRNCFREVSADVFANNRLSLTLLESNLSSALFNLFSDEYDKTIHDFPDVLMDPDYGGSYDTTKTVYTYGIEDKGFKGGHFDWLKLHPEKVQKFGRAMIGASAITDFTSVAETFPWAELPAGTTVCDVGGGVGTISMQIAKAHPKIRLTVQDLPQTIEEAKSVWARDYPQAVGEGRVDFIPVDFIAGPPVKGQDIYYLRHIIHNWPDKEAVTILRHIREAMTPNSRLLIHEYILQHADRRDNSEFSSTGLDVAPEPLLPNYGSGKIRHYTMDIIMLSVYNSGESPLNHLVALASEAGLRFAKYWSLGEKDIVEFSFSN